MTQLKYFFSIVIIIFIAEQLLYWIFSPYIYRYGLVVFELKNNIKEIDPECLSSVKISNFIFKIHKNSGKEVFMRYSFPFGTLGPLVFVGQIKESDPDTTTIRVGYITALLLLFPVAWGAEQMTFSTFGSGILCSVLPSAAYYYMFYSKFKLFIREYSRVKSASFGRIVK